MKKFAAILAAFVAVAALSAQSGVLERYLGVKLSELQLFALPFVIIALARARVFGVAIPPLVIAGGALAAVAAASHGYLNVRDNPQTVLVAHLRDDKFESQSRILRDQLNRVLAERLEHRELMTADRYHGSFRAHRDVEKFLRGTENLPFVLWGSRAWLTLSVRRPETPDPVLQSPWVDAFGLKMVTHVPVLGMSFEPLGATTEFLAALFQAELLRRDPSPAAQAERELLLREAATSRSHWTSYAHQAYPLWELGNLYFAQATGSPDGRVDLGLLECAIQAYTRARRLLKPGDNPEIIAAALNNRAIAHLVLAALGNRPELRQLVRKELRVAVDTLGQRNLFGVRYRAAKVARLNLRVLEKSRKGRDPRLRRNASGPDKAAARQGRVRSRTGSVI